MDMSDEIFCSVCIGQGRGKDSRYAVTIRAGEAMCMKHAEESWKRFDSGNGVPGFYSTRKQDLDFAKG